MNIKFKLGQIRLRTLTILLSSGLVVSYLLFLTFSYQNLWVHPHYFTDLLPIYTQDGHGFHWTDLLRALDHKRPGQYRPRFLNYVLLGLDIRLREWIIQFTVPHPTFSLGWFLSLGLAPLFLYRLVKRLTHDSQSAGLATLTYLSSIGLLSSVTLFFMPGKAMCVVSLIVSLELASRLWVKRKPGERLWNVQSPARFGLLAVIFISLFLDEFSILAFAVIPILFYELFWTGPRGRQAVARSHFWQIAQSWLLFLSPIALFLSLVIWMVPWVTRTYLGYDFQFLQSSLHYDESVTHLNLLRGLYENFMSLFGVSLIPSALSAMLPDAASSAENLLKQENNLPKLALFFVIFSMLASLIWRKRRDFPMLLRAALATAMFLLLHTIVNARHLSITNGFYYGSTFPVFLALLVGLVDVALPKDGWVKRLYPAFVLAVIWVQITNFGEINQSWQKVHNRFSRDEILKLYPGEIPSIQDNGPLSRQELHAIREAWVSGGLPQYLKSHPVTSGALYWVAELRRPHNPAIENPLGTRRLP